MKRAMPELRVVEDGIARTLNMQDRFLDFMNEETGTRLHSEMMPIAIKDSGPKVLFHLIDTAGNERRVDTKAFCSTAKVARLCGEHDELLGSERYIELQERTHKIHLCHGMERRNGPIEQERISTLV